MAFLIVEFKPDEFAGNTEPEVAIIPRNWLDGTSCSVWPPFRSGLRVTRAIKTGEVPASDWRSYPIRVLDKADTYERALYKQRKAEETSDLQTTASEEEAEEEYRLSKRKRKSTLRLIEDDMLESLSPPPVPSTSGSMDPPPSPPVHYPQRPLPVPSPVTPVPSSLLLPVPPSVTPLQSILDKNYTVSSYSGQVGRSPSALTGKDIIIIKMLEEIKMEIATLHSKVNRIILNKKQDQNHEDPTITEEVALPISSVDRLQELESHLSKVAYEKYLVSSLGAIGGSSLQDTVRRIMKKVLHHDVAFATNWTGKGGKTQFGTLKLSNVIIKAVRMNHNCAQSTHEDVKRGIKEWFRGAADRNGGRLKRQISKQLSTTTNK